MKKYIQVMKFGGTSVGDAACVRRAAEIIAAASQDKQIVAVVSAMSGVTNRLINAAQISAMGDETAFALLADALREQHRTAIHLLVTDEQERLQLERATDRIIGEAATLCRGTALLRELTPRALDTISSIGERLSARLLAGVLREMKIDSAAVEATELIVTDDAHGQAEPLMNETRTQAAQRLQQLLSDEAVPVVTGFIGATIKGTLTTLGRGGSDYSATILGAALDAREVIIWTDVDGVLTADPRLVPEAHTLDEISYNEAAELAYYGAKVLHPKTLRPVTDAGIPVWIRNSFAPEKYGTKITPHGHPTASGVKAITAVKNVSLVTVGGRGIVGVPDIVAKVFTATASVRANVLLISQASSQNDICFIVDSVDIEHTLAALRGTFAIALSHSQVEHITVNSEIAIVAVVGERMHGMVGVAGRTFGALGRDGISVIAIAQGSSEYNISFVVEADLMQRAVVAVHREFNLERRGISKEDV